MRIFLFTIWAGVLLGSFAFATDPPIAKTPEITFAVPGQGQQTIAQYKTKVIAIEFLSTACLPCERSAQSLTALQKEFGGENLQAVLIAVNPNAEETVGDFAHKLRLDIPVGWTTRKQAQQFLNYGPGQTFLLPQIVLINNQNQTRLQTTPREMDELRQESVLRRRIQAWVNEKPQNSVPRNFR